MTTYDIILAYPNDGEYLWHVVPGVLLDDGHHLAQLLEEVLTHVLVTCSHHTQEWRHHLVGSQGSKVIKGQSGINIVLTHATSTQTHTHTPVVDRERT